MLLARIPIQRHGDVVPEVERALRRRHDVLLARRHQHPLALLAVAGDVHLERMRIVVLAIAPHNAARVIQVLDVVAKAREVRRPE